MFVNTCTKYIVLFNIMYNFTYFLQSFLDCFEHCASSVSCGRYFYTRDKNTLMHIGHRAVLLCLPPTHRCNASLEGLSAQPTHPYTQIRPSIDSYMLTHFIIITCFYGNHYHPSLPLPT